MKISVIITAGGSSVRFGKTNKLLQKINSKELIKYTVDAFMGINEITQIIICSNPSIIDELRNIFKEYKQIKIIEGGKTRQESVFNGLKACQNCDYVLIHDGARPMITKDIIKNAIRKVQEKKALTVATKTIDTIKQVDENLKIIKTLDRSSLYNTQTPQAFEYELIKEAHEKLQGKDFTDDAGMLEFSGKEVYVIEGDYINIKVTTQADLEFAKTYL
ncbi:MAG TPA: 2-C-methyl-D-erythritol 4-phosphate cytidylyltransferase [Candidatus Gastranaerophilaceae bacterium]|nr:2-C-methyl-D-erythritol 4-phosphate cytidylyltransferase [Candidatus Gastranaerophilaceae bacterium]